MSLKACSRCGGCGAYMLSSCPDCDGRGWTGYAQEPTYEWYPPRIIWPCQAKKGSSR